MSSNPLIDLLNQNGNLIHSPNQDIVPFITTGDIPQKLIAPGALIKLEPIATLGKIQVIINYYGKDYLIILPRLEAEYIWMFQIQQPLWSPQIYLINSLIKKAHLISCHTNNIFHNPLWEVFSGEVFMGSGEGRIWTDAPNGSQIKVNNDTAQTIEKYYNNLIDLAIEEAEKESPGFKEIYLRNASITHP